MQYIINIGLDNMPSEAGNTVGRRALFAARALRAHGFTTIATQVLNSDTEPTLVAEVKSGYSYTPAAVRIAELSSALNQDCIATLFPDGSGALLGPRAAAWGTFNPEYFFLLDGSRLAQPLQAAA